MLWIICPERLRQDMLDLRTESNVMAAIQDDGNVSDASGCFDRVTELHLQTQTATCVIRSALRPTGVSCHI
eukprot:4702042-Amphidinium_carterae.2